MEVRDYLRAYAQAHGSSRSEIQQERQRVYDLAHHRISIGLDTNVREAQLNAAQRLWRQRVRAPLERQVTQRDRAIEAREVRVGDTLFMVDIPVVSARESRERPGATIRRPRTPPTILVEGDPRRSSATDSSRQTNATTEQDRGLALHQETVNRIVQDYEPQLDFRLRRSPSLPEEVSEDMSMPWLERPAPPPWQPPGPQISLPGNIRRQTREEQEIYSGIAERGYATDYDDERLYEIDRREQIREQERYEEARERQSEDEENREYSVGENGELIYGAAGIGAFGTRRERRIRQDLARFSEIRDRVNQFSQMQQTHDFVGNRIRQNGRGFPQEMGIQMHRLMTRLYNRAAESGDFNYQWIPSMDRLGRERFGADFVLRVSRGRYISLEFTTIGQSQDHAYRERYRNIELSDGRIVRAERRIIMTYDPNATRRLEGTPVPTPRGVSADTRARGERDRRRRRVFNRRNARARRR